MSDADFTSDRRTKRGPAAVIPGCVDGRCYHRWTPDPFWTIAQHEPHDAETGAPSEVCAACRMERVWTATGRARTLSDGRRVPTSRYVYGPEWRTTNDDINGLWTQRRETGGAEHWRTHILGTSRSMTQVREMHARIAGFLARFGSPGAAWRVFCCEPGHSVSHLLTVSYALPVAQ